MRTMLKDIKVYTMLSKVGHAKDDQLLKLTSANRLKTLTRKKMLNKIRTVKENGKIDVSYKLMRLGKKALEAEKYIENYYSARSPEHDTILAEKYLSLDPVERKSWCIEQENKSYVKHFNSSYMSVPDASYIKNGQRIFLEAITKHYSKEQIEEKIEFAKAADSRIELLK